MDIFPSTIRTLSSLLYIFYRRRMLSTPSALILFLLLSFIDYDSFKSSLKIPPPSRISFSSLLISIHLFSAHLYFSSLLIASHRFSFSSLSLYLPRHPFLHSFSFLRLISLLIFSIQLSLHCLSLSRLLILSSPSSS